MKLRNRYQAGNSARWSNARSAAFALLLLSVGTIPVPADLITDWNDIAPPLLRTVPLDGVIGYIDTNAPVGSALIHTSAL